MGNSSSSRELKPNPDQYWQLIVAGYVRRQNQAFNMNIPEDIGEIIFLYYQMSIDIESKILTNGERMRLISMVANQLETQILKFDLIYRGTDHGFEHRNFWSRCNGIKPAFVIVETVQNKVFGGYASIGFSDVDYVKHRADKNAFLYSIRNDAGYPPKIFPVLKKYENEAIAYHYTYLCNFGKDSCGICLESGCNLPNKNCGARGESFMPSRQYGYLNGKKPNKAHLGIQVKELELFQLTHE